MKKALLTALAACFLLFATSCTNTAPNKKPQQKTLRITYDSSLYGSNWMNNAAKLFQKTHSSIALKITADSQLTQHYTALLESGQNTPDLIFLARTDWQEDAAAGKLANLNTLYIGTGGGAPLLSKLRDGVAPSCMLNGQYYVYPWGARTGGLLYSARLFNQYGWQVPQTVSALDSLCAQIRIAGIAPFTWSADHASDWTDNVTEWWAQYEGQASMQTYLAMQSPSVYGEQGRLQALQAFEELLPQNSYNTPLTMNEGEAVKAFTGGHAAMMPAGYLPVFAANAPSDDLDVHVMALPAPDGAKAPGLLAATIPGIAVVPAKAAEQALAQTFLSDLTSDEALSLFIAATGQPTPFVLDKNQTDHLPRLLKSACALWQSDTLYMLSEQPVYYRRLFDWPAQGSPVLQIFSGTRTAQQAFDDNLAAAQSNWSNALS
ncbi:MAG: ABC transporter substrate-binding protein [Ethanoligenens sp.]|uniref:ABC transporter substrate-binding protein n=1 Tax=Ethanoligenens sp. TaxID=2099655 RepID=UPI0039E90F87